MWGALKTLSLMWSSSGAQSTLCIKTLAPGLHESFWCCILFIEQEQDLISIHWIKLMCPALSHAPRHLPKILGVIYSLTFKCHVCVLCSKEPLCVDSLPRMTFTVIGMAEEQLAWLRTKLTIVPLFPSFFSFCLSSPCLSLSFYLSFILSHPTLSLSVLHTVSLHPWHSRGFK